MINKFDIIDIFKALYSTNKNIHAFKVHMEHEKLKLGWAMQSASAL